MIRVGPGFGDWLRTVRKEQHFTVRGLASAARLSPGTISPLESRRYAAPSVEVTRGISSALGVPVLAVAVVAAMFEADRLDFFREKFWDAVTAGIGLSVRDTWFAKVGGHYVGSVRESARIEVAQAAQRWSDAWAIPITADEWNIMETRGQLPEHWAHIVGTQMLDRLPGPWLWAILDAASADGTVSRDLILIAFLLGRLRRQTSEVIGAADDYDAFMRSCPAPADRGDARIARYVSWARAYVPAGGWTIASIRAMAAAPATVPDEVSELTARERRLIAQYRRLSPDDRSVIDHLLAGLLEKVHE